MVGKLHGVETMVCVLQKIVTAVVGIWPHVARIELVAMSSMAMGVLVTRMICVWQHGSNGPFGKDGCLSA
jgi:hypothetical protein